MATLQDQALLTELVVRLQTQVEQLEQRIHQLETNPQIIRQYVGGGGISRGKADDRFVNETGDTMTGNLNMGGNDITSVDDLDAQTMLVTPAATDVKSLELDGSTNPYTGTALNYGLYSDRTVSSGTSAGFQSYGAYAGAINNRAITNQLGSGGTMQTYGIIGAALDYGNFTQGALPLASCTRKIYGYYFSAVYQASELQSTSNALQVTGVYSAAQCNPTINKGGGSLTTTTKAVHGVASTVPTLTAGTYVHNMYGVHGEATGTTDGLTTTYGVYGKAGGGDVNWAGYFDIGDVYVTSTFNCGDVAMRTNKSLVFAESPSLTISGGVITVVGVNNIVKPEAGAADDLDTINGGTDGEVIVIRGDGVATVTVKDGSGNINCAGDFAMDAAADTMMLMYDGTNSEWLELSRSNNA